MTNIKISVTGIDALTKKLEGLTGATALNNADKISETYARKIANEAAENAPVKDNILAPALAASPERLEKGVWQIGNNGVEYTRRQEYEHPTRKGFIRKAVWDNREAYREKLRKEFTSWK